MQVVRWDVAQFPGVHIHASLNATARTISSGSRSALRGYGARPPTRVGAHGIAFKGPLVGTVHAEGVTPDDSPYNERVEQVPDSRRPVTAAIVISVALVGAIFTAKQQDTEEEQR